MLPGNRYRILLGLGCQLLGRKFSSNLDG
jgi:hypothetical protein